MKISGLTVLISGGGAGIGLSLAMAFARAGCKIIICGRNSDTLRQAQEQVPGIVAAQCDIASRESVQAFASTFSKQIDVLVNNASISQAIDLTDLDTNLESQILEVDINLLGTLRMLHAFLPGLLTKPEAAIVNVSSALAFIPSADRPVYCATKAAMHSLSLSLRHQLRGTRVKVFELMPPLTDTSMAAKVRGVPKLAPEKVATALIAAISADHYEITPGLSRVTKWISRIAPGFGFSQLNKTVS